MSHVPAWKQLAYVRVTVAPSHMRVGRVYDTVEQAVAEWCPGEFITQYDARIPDEHPLQFLSLTPAEFERAMRAAKETS